MRYVWYTLRCKLTLHLAFHAFRAVNLSYRQYRVKRRACAILSRFFAKAREVRPRLQPVEVHGVRPHESYLRAAGAAFSIFAPLHHSSIRPSPPRPIDLFLAHSSTSIGFPVSFHQVDPDLRRLRPRTRTSHDLSSLDVEGERLSSYSLSSDKCRSNPLFLLLSFRLPFLLFFLFLTISCSFPKPASTRPSNFLCLRSCVLSSIIRGFLLTFFRPPTARQLPSETFYLTIERRMEREPASTLNQQYLSAILPGARNIYIMPPRGGLMCAP